MPTPKIQLTEQGFLNLKNKISDLNERLSEVTKGKGEAFESGGNGWHENSAFEDMVERERVLSQELKDLSHMFDAAEVVAVTPSDAAGIGAVVTLAHPEDGEIVYIITDPFCVDLEERRISYDSPMGRSLMGKRVGDEIRIKPNDETNARVASVVYMTDAQA